MKRVTPSLITIGLSLLLALFSAALTYSGPSDAQRMSLSSGAFFAQVTPHAAAGGQVCGRLHGPDRYHGRCHHRDYPGSHFDQPKIVALICLLI